MEQAINTISRSEANGFQDNKGSFTLDVNFERNQEQDGNELVTLNDLSIDAIEILQEQKRKNGVIGLEGELLVNHNSDVLLEVDNDGSFIITDYNVDKFSINEMGELIMEL